MLTTRIPERGKELFNLYVYGDLRDEIGLGDQGVSITMAGTVVLFYKYPGYRRAYIVCEGKYGFANYIPNVREPVKIIYTAQGLHRVDVLRRACMYIRKHKLEKAYSFPVEFWQKVGGLIDNSTSYNSMCTESNLKILIDSYAQRTSF